MARKKSRSTDVPRRGRDAPRQGRSAPARSRPRPRSAQSLPVLPIAVGVVLAAVAAVFVYIGFTSRDVNAGPKTVNSIQCNATEQVATHYHAHLTILFLGAPAKLPPNIGIPSSGSCLYWLHTHDDTGVIHIEAPPSQGNRVFTLGDFFSVWNQPLTSTRVASFTLTADQKLVVFVDGKAYAGDPTKIQLKNKQQIVLEITPPIVDPPPNFDFPANL